MIALLAVFTTVPYVYGYITRPHDTTLSGIHHLVQGDVNTYLSMIEDAKAGKFLFINLFTAEDQPRILFNPLWLATGWVARLLQSSALFAFHLARLALIIALIFALDRLIRLCVEGEKSRRIIMVILLFSSGFGVFFNPILFNLSDIIQHPTDIWVPESNTFLTAMQSPHLLASLVLLILTLTFAMESILQKSIRKAWIAGGTGALLFLLHPFYVPTVFCVVAVWVVVLGLSRVRIPWKPLATWFIVIICSLPVLAYFYWMYHASFPIAMWSDGNILPSPYPSMYLIGYGLLTPFALYGAIRSFQKPALRLVTFWVIVTCLLLYAPIDFQRRLVEGLHVGISILAGVGAVDLYYRLKKRAWALGVTLVMMLAIFLPLTNLQLVFQDIYDFSHASGYPYFIPKADTDAFAWIKKNVPADEVIFSSFYTGNFLPAYTSHKVFIGHGPQTIFLPQKEFVTAAFFSHVVDDAWRKEFLSYWGIQYVFFGINEKGVGPYQPSSSSLFIPVYENKETVIFKTTF